MYYLRYVYVCAVCNIILEVLYLRTDHMRMCAESAVDLVEKQVQKRELNNWYEARLIAQEPSEKGRKVYCYITPRVSPLW